MPDDLHDRLDAIGQRHAVNREKQEQANAEARAIRADAEPLILDALRASVGPTEIRRRTGYSRQTINTIREDAGIPAARWSRTEQPTPTKETQP